MSFMFSKNIALALHSMRVSRSRSFFTMLGVIIAVASVTVIVSIGGGIKQSVIKQANVYSKNVITIRPQSIGSNGGVLAPLSNGTAATSLSNKDVTTIAKVPGVSSSVPLTIVGTSATGDHAYRGVVFAVSTELPKVLSQQLAYGGYFTDKESSNNVAILGAKAAEQMFDQRVPLGQTFTINGQEFIVNGILSKFADTPFTTDTNYNDAIFVPNSAIKVLTPSGAPTYQILAKVSDGTDIEAADTAITKALNKAHGGQLDVNVFTPTELAQATTSSFGLLTYLILAASIVTLLVSGIGIMNVMLVSVTERIHEIGIRKAVGATNRQIYNQFLTEAAALSVIGSVIGVATAYVVCVLLKIFTSLAPQFNLPVAGLACFVACAFGIIFGTLPAVKAARKDPISALRNE